MVRTEVCIVYICNIKLVTTCIRENKTANVYFFGIKALYFNTYSRVRVNDELTSPIVIGWGAKQGCTLCPTLFTVDINDLIDCLNQEDNGIRLLVC